MRDDEHYPMHLIHRRDKALRQIAEQSATPMTLPLVSRFIHSRLHGNNAICLRSTSHLASSLNDFSSCNPDISDPPPLFRVIRFKALRESRHELEHCLWFFLFILTFQPICCLLWHSGKGVSTAKEQVVRNVIEDVVYWLSDRLDRFVFTIGGSMLFSTDGEGLGSENCPQQSSRQPAAIFSLFFCPFFLW